MTAPPSPGPTAPSPVERLGVIDRGESAVRVLNAIGALNAAGDAAPITTILFHRNPPDPTPWDGREADEVRSLSPDGTDADLVDALQRAQVDTLWLGEWSPGPRADLVEACAAAGIEAAGFSSERR